MSETTKITATHLQHTAVVYVRQSTTTQIAHNCESTDRQYRLAERAMELGWPRERVHIIDEDLGVSGSGIADRTGFARLTTQVALGNVGIVLGLEVSRLARNNADWYRLLDLCGVTDTLIGDADGIYHPGLFNDRLVLGLKGTMSEAELHILRARLNGGIRNKAARGELRRGLPMGFVWGEADGEVLFHPDEAVTTAIRTIFARFAEMGSARQVWLWLRAQGLRFPLQAYGMPDMQWITPTYTKIHQVLTNPVYAGAYVYGRTRSERYVDASGRVRKRMRHLPRSEWSVVIREHHEGFIDWETFEANQERIATNARPAPHEPGGAVREGSALLQGIASCGRCGRGLHVYYSGRASTPAYYCPGHTLTNGRGEHCMRISGRHIEAAVTEAVLAALEPATLAASIHAAEEIEANHDAAVTQCQHDVERARYAAQRAERRYRAVDPDNRLVARGLETEWNRCLEQLDAADAALHRRTNTRPRELTHEERTGILRLRTDLHRVWSAPTTTDRDRKEVVRTLLDEVNITVTRAEHRVDLILRWRGGLITEIRVDSSRVRHEPRRTAEDTVALIRRLAVHYPDAVIAGILNRQERKTARGLTFTASRVGSLRTHWKIPCCASNEAHTNTDGECLSIKRVAKELGVQTSTVHRWLNDGFIAGEQLTPGAPWRIRLTADVRSRFVEETPPGYVAMLKATHLLGVSRQTILHRVKRGELNAVHVRTGRRKGLRIQVTSDLPTLFDQPKKDRGVV
jgi:DNA invertase Pin-like site-specific DNA recombinase